MEGFLRSAVYYVFDNNKHEQLELLLECGADRKLVAEIAARKGMLDLVKRMMESGVNDTGAILYAAAGGSFLSRAAEGEPIRVIEYLLSRETYDVEVIMDALRHAAEGERSKTEKIEIFKLIYGKYADDLDTKLNELLRCAWSLDQDELAEMLIQRGIEYIKNNLKQ